MPLPCQRPESPRDGDTLVTARAVVDDWLSGFGDPPLQLSQLQKDWLIIGIATAIRKATARPHTATETPRMTTAQSEPPLSTQPECPYCGATEGLRKLHDGYGSEPPEYTCEACFTAMDDGPCFEDLEPVSHTEQKR